MKHKVVIVDDEISGINVLTKMIEAYVPDAEVVGSFSDPSSAIIGIRKLNPDLVFSDIEMDEMTGIELFTSLADLDFTMVFVTAHNNYTIQALRSNAFDYLLKPIKLNEFLNVFRRLNNEAIKPTSKKSNSIILNTSKKVLFVPVNDIIMIKGEGSYCHFFLLSGAQEIVSKNLAHFERELDNSLFFRSHKSYLVNLHHVQNLNLEDGLIIELNGDLTALLSGSKKVDFLKSMG